MAVLYRHMNGMPLGEAEAEVLALWQAGHTRSAIAALRGRSHGTIAHQIVMLKSKLGCETDDELRAFTGANV